MGVPARAQFPVGTRGGGGGDGGEVGDVVAVAAAAGSEVVDVEVVADLETIDDVEHAPITTHGGTTRIARIGASAEFGPENCPVTAARTYPGPVFIDGFVHQLPDIDPQETGEWLDSLDSVIDIGGRARARYLLARLMERAREQGVGVPAMVTSDYINTIPPEQEPWFPGDELIERRIRAYIRWNAMAMVDRANHRFEGLGGHLSTFASAAALYDVGFNHFFRGKGDGGAGDQVFFQGHAAPGIYARAFLEGRLTEDHLDRFRREVDGGGLPSYPHPRRMPEFWEFPTVSMGLGPLNAVAQARFNRYLMAREIADTSKSKVWAFVGDGEMDEPEAMAGLSLAAREQLDNLIFVVNCNLQRLDGPVRGNGKIIQELEATFRGAGWNVIKVIWGRGWDDLLARDVDGVLVNQMNTTVDGEFQKYAVESGSYIREHFFGPDPRLQRLVEHLTDDDLRMLPRGGHDYRKLYAAYKMAMEHEGSPTVILAKTIKGWTLGKGIESRNATHQIKKLTTDELKVFRDRLQLPIPDAEVADGDPPFWHPGTDSPEFEYMMARRRALGGSVPERVVRKKMFTAPVREHTPETAGPFADVFAGTGDKVQASTTTAFARLLRNLLRDPDVGSRIVPIIPDEARTFGLDALFREYKIYAAFGQRYEPVDAELLLSYREASNGRILEEGITEAGSMAMLTAAGTSYATWGQPMIPFFIFYSMFGFQRVGDLIWAFGDQRGRGFLLGATAGRTTLAGEGLQHCDGQSQLLASAYPNCRGLRSGVRLRDGSDHPRRHRADVRAGAGRLLLLHHPLQRELPDAGDARGRGGRHHPRSLPVPGGAHGRPGRAARADPGERHRDAGIARRATHPRRGVRRGRRRVERDELQDVARGSVDRRALEPPASHRARRVPRTSPRCCATARARSSRSPTS